MLTRRQILTILLLFAVVHALAGQGLVVLCVDESGAHSAFEKTTADTCPAKPAADDCGEDELHYDDPANHPGDVDPCTDTLVKLSQYTHDRNDRTRATVDLPHTPPSLTVVTSMKARPVAATASPGQLDTSPPAPLHPSISSTVLLV